MSWYIDGVDSVRDVPIIRWALLESLFLFCLLLSLQSIDNQTDTGHHIKGSTNIDLGGELYRLAYSCSLIAHSPRLIYVQFSVPMMEVCLAVSQWQQSNLHRAPHIKSKEQIDSLLPIWILSREVSRHEGNRQEVGPMLCRLQKSVTDLSYTYWYWWHGNVAHAYQAWNHYITLLAVEEMDNKRLFCIAQNMTQWLTWWSNRWHRGDVHTH